MKKIETDAIRRVVGNRTGDIEQWLKALVRIPSENRPPGGNEGPAQEFIESECRNIGLEVDVFSPDEIPEIKKHASWLSGRRYGKKRRNVVARWKGKGGGRSILFSGHVDVAPFEPDNWKACRPFEPVEKNGRLYGRGTADMKGGLASAFWAIRILKDIGFEPGGDILFESLVDEEFAGGNGTLAARLRGHNADMAVIPEATRMEICPACLGAFLGELTLAGKAGMPYMGSAIPNPISGAARAIELFAEWEKKWRKENRHPLFTAPGKELNTLLWRIDSTQHGEFTQMGTPLIARIAWIVWCHPGLTEEEFYRKFRSFWQGHAASDPALTPFSLKLEPEFHYVKPWETPADSPAVRAVADAFQRYEKTVPSIGGAPFSSDFSIYGESGNMPAVLLGPRGDNLHAPDEWVELNDVFSLAGIFAGLSSVWTAPQGQDARQF